MNDLLGMIYSIPFAVGLIIGLVAQRLVVWWRCCWLNKNRPRDNGRPHTVPSLSRVWCAGAVAVGVLGYILLQVGQTEGRYEHLAASVAACNRELIAAQKARSDLAAENDRLSREQRALLAESDEASNAWINRIVNPPPDIVGLELNDPRRQQWSLDVTRVYFERAGKINEKIYAIAVEQQKLDLTRAAHPLPEPTCADK